MGTTFAFTRYRAWLWTGGIVLAIAGIFAVIFVLPAFVGRATAFKSAEIIGDHLFVLFEVGGKAHDYQIKVFGEIAALDVDSGQIRFATDY